MKINVIILSALLLGLLLLGGEKGTNGIKNETNYTKYEMKIETDVQKYSLLMSSVLGIGITPKVSANLKGTNKEYYWTTNSGGFLETNRTKEAKNSGEKLTWLPQYDGDSKIIIRIKAVDIESGIVLSKNELTIEKVGVNYIVKSEVNTASNFSIYLVEDLNVVQAMGQPINLLRLASEPILTEKEISTYRWQGERIYLGSFWTPFSSVNTPSIPIISSAWFKGEKKDTYSINNININDSRDDKRIYESLKSLGKIIED